MASLDEVPRSKENGQASCSAMRLDPIKESKMELNKAKSNLSKSKSQSGLAINSNKINLTSKAAPATKQTIIAPSAAIGTPPKTPATTSKPSICSMNNNKPRSNPIMLGKKSRSPVRTVNLPNALGVFKKTSLNEAEKSSSAKSNVSASSSSRGLDQPSQPIICTMFEGFPQPFTSRSNISDNKSTGGSTVKGGSNKSATAVRKQPFSTTKKAPTKTKTEPKTKTKTKKTKPGIIFYFEIKYNLGIILYLSL